MNVFKDYTKKCNVYCFLKTNKTNVKMTKKHRAYETAYTLHMKPTKNNDVHFPRQNRAFKKKKRTPNTVRPPDRLWCLIYRKRPIIYGSKFTVCPSGEPILEHEFPRKEIRRRCRAYNQVRKTYSPSR